MESGSVLSFAFTTTFMMAFSIASSSPPPMGVAVCATFRSVVVHIGSPIQPPRYRRSRLATPPLNRAARDARLEVNLVFVEPLLTVAVNAADMSGTSATRVVVQLHGQPFSSLLRRRRCPVGQRIRSARS